MNRVQAGERLTVTRYGQPAAELRPGPRWALDTSTLLKRWCRRRRVDPLRFRVDDPLSADTD